MRNFQNTFDTRKRSFISVFQKISKYVLRILFWGSQQSLDLSLRKLHDFRRLWMKRPLQIYHNFTKFPGMETLWKNTVSAKFRANCPKLCRNCAFPQNFHTKKLGEIMVLLQWSFHP